MLIRLNCANSSLPLIHDCQVSCCCHQIIISSQPSLMRLYIHNSSCADNCTEDKLWVDCIERPPCPNTCSDIGHPNGCVEPDVCVPRCACPVDMVEDKDGHCVHTNSCICVDDAGNEYTNGFVDRSNPCQIW